METEKKAYSELKKLLRKHKDVWSFDVNNIERSADLHLLGLELKEKYGLNLDPKRISSFDYMEFGEHKYISQFGQKYNRTISWSDSGDQPKDELLVFVKFPTGPYIFGDGGTFNKDYPVDFFHKFWNELLTFNPDYTDTNNKGLYWKLENAKDIFNSFDGVLKKYHELNREDIKQRRIEQMKKDLEKLQNS